MKTTQVNSIMMTTNDFIDMRLGIQGLLNLDLKKLHLEDIPLIQKMLHHEYCDFMGIDYSVDEDTKKAISELCARATKDVPWDEIQKQMQLAYCSNDELMMLFMRGYITYHEYTLGKDTEVAKNEK